MRLFGKIDGTINRFDRAEWLSCPFDLAFLRPVPAVPERVFGAPPRGATFDSPNRGGTFAAPPRGTVFEMEA